MSILESFYKAKDGEYKGSYVFFYEESFGANNKDRRLDDIYPVTLTGTPIGAESVKWWNSTTDEANASKVREYLGIIATEREFINMYISSNKNVNTGKMIKRLIELNCVLIDFFLTYVNKLYWKETRGDPPKPQEKSGMTIEECQDLCLPVAENLSEVVNTIMENEMPHKVISNILRTNFLKDKLGHLLETSNLKSINKIGKKHNQKKQDQ